MIDQVQLTSWAPDTDENNPGLLADAEQVYPITRGFRSLGVPSNRAPSPEIKFLNDSTAGDITTVNRYYPPPVNAYTAYWADGTSDVYVLTEQTTVSAILVGGAEVVNGGLYRLVDGVFTLIGYKESSTSARTNEPATTPVAWTDVFDLDPNHFGSFAQFGDYCFLADGDALIYIQSGDAAGDPKVDAVGLTTTANADGTGTGGTVAPKFVAQAGDFVFVSCDNSSAVTYDAKGVLVDSTYWRCSVAGVIDSDGKPDFSLANSDATRSESARAADTSGPIIGMRALDRTVMVYKERSTYMIMDDGSSMVQQVLSTEVGPLCDSAVVDFGGKHVFVGHNDFYFVEGQTVQSLPNPCREFLLGPGGDLDKERYFGVRGQHNRIDNCVYWYYPSVAYSSFQQDTSLQKPVCDKWVCWNYLTDTWSRGSLVGTNNGGRRLGLSAVCNPDMSKSDAITYTEFPASISYTTWNTDVDITWTSPLIVGSGDRAPGYFTCTILDSSGNFISPINQLAGFIMGNGDLWSGWVADGYFLLKNDVTLLKNNSYVVPPNPSNGVSCQIRTGDFGDGVNLKFVRGIRPRFIGPTSPTDVSCTIYVREHLSDNWRNAGSSYAGTSELNSGSPFWFSVRANARYLQFLFSFTGMAELSGYDIDYDDAGTR